MLDDLAKDVEQVTINFAFGDKPGALRASCSEFYALMLPKIRGLSGSP
jgi:hypothetical protein